MGTNGIAAFIDVTVEAGSGEVCLWALMALRHLLVSLWRQEVERCAYEH